MLRRTENRLRLGIIFFLGCSSSFAQSKDTTISGTLIMALGNANGAVVLTDSMQTRGDKQLAEPGQKMLRLDSKTICAIAGLGGTIVPVAPELNAQTLGIIDNLADDKTDRSMDKKLDLLDGMLRFYLSTLADVNSTTLRNLRIGYDYHSAVLLVGYDTDEQLKIGTLEFAGTPELYRGRVYWDFHSTTTLRIVPKTFDRELKGMPHIAYEILNSPAEYSLYPAVVNFKQRYALDRGASLTLTDLKALGDALLAETANVHKEVGGPTQVAVFSGGQITEFRQPDFPEKLKRPMGLALVRGLSWTGSGGILAEPGIIIVYESVAFPRGYPLLLDGTVLLNCTITDSVVQYHGGVTYIDENTVIANSALHLSPNVDMQSPRTQSLLNFPWVFGNPQ